jgi:hypothetical protein
MSIITRLTKAIELTKPTLRLGKEAQGKRCCDPMSFATPEHDIMSNNRWKIDEDRSC